MKTLLHDLRYATRSLRNSPGFTLTAILTLALGIGANSAIFSVVNGVLLRSLPFEKADQLVQIFTTDTQSGELSESLSAPDFISLREQSRVFTEMVAFDPGGATLTGVGEPIQLEGLWVSAGFFEMLGVAPVLGRTFQPEENQAGKDDVVILSHGLWQQRFGGNLDILRRPLTLNGIQRTVVGVMPAGFAFPEGHQLWAPLEYDESFSSETAQNRRAQWLGVLARLKPDATIEQAQTEVRTVAQRLEREFAETNTNVGATLRPLHEVMVGNMRTPLLVLLGAVGFVLLIACVNVANLLLARVATRENEIAVRIALGAGRGRLIRQLLTESILLGLAGGVLGLVLATWGVEVLVSFQPEDLPQVRDLGVDATVVAFTAAVALLTGVLFGLIPALQVTRPDLVRSLKEGGRGALSGRRGTRLRSALVVAEMALAVMLLTGAGLLIRSFVQLQRVDPGFRSEGVLAFELSLPSAMYSEDPKIEQFYAHLIERLRGLPGVRSAGAVLAVPLSGTNLVITFDVAGREPAQPGEEVAMQVRIATPDYFQTMGIPLRRGRGLTEQDRAGAPQVVLLNEAAVRRFFPDENTLGQRIQLGWRIDDSTYAGGEVVGIVGDVKQSGLDREAQPEIYLPHAQVPLNSMDLVLRTDGDPLGLAGAIRREVRALDPNLPIQEFRTIEQVVAESVARPRFYTTLLAAFASVALLLAAVGVFGVMSYSVAQRTREIGIRTALGAEPGDVLRMVVRRALALATAGVVIGLLGALGLTRVLESLLFGVSTTDPLTFLAVAATLTAVALLASYLPAHRATRIDPMIALRSE